MKACRAGHLCTVQFLIVKGGDVNKTTTNNDHTPLSLACAGGHLPVVELLLVHGADPHHKLKVRSRETLILCYSHEEFSQHFISTLTVTPQLMLKMYIS